MNNFLHWGQGTTPQQAFDMWVDLNDPGLEGADVTPWAHADLVKAAFLAACQWEREECARAADRKMEAATAAEPCVEPASESIRAGHFAVAASQISDAIRARGDEK